MHLGTTLLDLDTKAGEQESPSLLQLSEHPTKGFAKAPESILKYSLPGALKGSRYSDLSESENKGNCGG